MLYKGHAIIKVKNYYMVCNEHGFVANCDTVEEAKEEIDKVIGGK